MATPLNTNELRLYRRHVTHCTRYQNSTAKPDTFEPSNKTEAKADTCQCPIWVRGYLSKELKSGKLKRVFCSTGYATWEQAGTKKREWELCGRLPAVSPVQVVQMDKSAITVKFAAEDWLEKRGNLAGADPVGQTTLDMYTTMIKQRLIPYCLTHGIVLIKAFQEKAVCEAYMHSWRQLKGPNKGAVLGATTKRAELTRLRIFLNWCVDSEYLTKHGAKKIKVAINKNTRRYGLELDEYDRLLATPAKDTDLGNEMIVAAKLMRHCGLRISDAVSFDSSEIVPNASGKGWNASFIPEKTKKYGVVCTVPMPQHVKDLLESLPGRTVGGKKHYFTIGYSYLKASITKWGKAAQKETKFAHKFGPHTLRHTFAIQNLNHGVPLKTVSKWLGHQSISTTEKYYSSPLLSTEMQEERDYELAAAAMNKATTNPSAPVSKPVVVMKAAA